MTYLFSMKMLDDAQRTKEANASVFGAAVKDPTLNRSAPHDVVSVNAELVGLLTGNNSAHAALRRGNVTDIAGNQVHMNMEDTLASRCADIDADVVTVGVETLIDQLFDTVQESQHVCSLFLRQIEE